MRKMPQFIRIAVIVAAAAALGTATRASAAPRAESALECGIAADMAVVAHSLAKEQIQRTKANTIIYHASQAACSKCPMKSRCCPNTPRRKIARSVHESARDVARNIAKTDAYKQSRKDRKKVEVRFAHLKRILRLDRLRLRGPNGAHDEFLLAATAQNLRRMAKWLFSAQPEVTSMAI